ncbi:rhodanese-like domain-containing protein [Fibrobacterota bacterium]
MTIQRPSFFFSLSVLTRYCICILCICSAGSGQTEAPGDSSLEEPGLRTDTSFSEVKPQLDSAVSIIKRTGRALKRKIEEFAKQLDDSALAKKNPDHMEQKIRKLFSELTKDQTRVPVIKAWQMQKIMEDSNLVIIDVRQPAEQAVSMIPGSLSPPDFADTFKDPSSLTGKQIITYCTIGYRSGLYAEQLISMGLSVHNLEGGLMAWTHVLGPLICRTKQGKQNSTREVHTYSEEWNLLHPDYTPVW